ncbi:MAG: transposase [Gemmatimonadota bacterium]
MSPLYAKIQAVEGGAGRDAVDPRILLALWMFATIEGVSSARHLERLTERDIAYMWICGDVGVNHHLLSDFLTAHGGFLQARRRAAAERAATDRAERIAAALENLQELEAQKEARKKGTSAEARASTTDPEARSMKMGDGGFRPAYNVQFATDGDARMIVAVEVTNNGSDGGQMSPLHEQVCQRYQKTPTHYAVDGGFATIDDITLVERAGSQVAAPMLSEERIRERGGDPHARRARDTDEMFAFRQRMATEEAKAILRRRPSIAEFPNANCRNHGLYQFRVRGLRKVRAVALWHAITFNFLRMLNLGALPGSLGMQPSTA